MKLNPKAAVLKRKSFINGGPSISIGRAKLPLPPLDLSLNTKINNELNAINKKIVSNKLTLNLSKSNIYTSLLLILLVTKKIGIYPAFQISVIFLLVLH